jgi:hypothetical protein
VPGLVRGQAHRVSPPAELWRLREDAVVWPRAGGSREVYLRIVPSKVTLCVGDVVDRHYLEVGAVGRQPGERAPDPAEGPGTTGISAPARHGLAGHLAAMVPRR